MSRQGTPFKRKSQAGNATIYVLILVALFAALSFTLMRQNDTSESAMLEGEKVEIIASQIIAYPFQVKQAIEMMTMTGSEASDLVFTLPDEGTFNDPPTINKVYHPDGGGLNPARLPDEAIAEFAPQVPAGWYLGRFNNVEWTLSTAEDILLAAFQISKPVCEKINEKLTGSSAIPALGTNLVNVMVDDDIPGHTGSNVGLTAVVCPDCEEMPALCVSNTGATAFGFYSIIVNR